MWPLAARAKLHYNLQQRTGPRVGPGPRPARLREAAGDRPAGLPPDDLGGIPPLRRRRPAGGARGRGIRADRKRRASSQVANPQAVTARGRRPLEIIGRFRGRSDAGGDFL